MTFTLARLTPDNWCELRDVRLRALADAPSAFGARLADEQALDEAAWRAMLAERTQLVVRDRGQVIGTAAAILDDGMVWLISMWVAPAARGQGVGEALVRGVLDRAAELDCAEIRLRVTVGNDGAERLYTRLGFVRTGFDEPIDPAEPSRREVELRWVGSRAVAR